MLVVDVILTALIILSLSFFIYEKFIMNFMHGKTVLRILLKRKNKLDCLIFIGLSGILIYSNTSAKGIVMTDWLLLSLSLTAACVFWIRTPELCFKRTGFFYAGLFILYNHIKNINLSEDGILVITLTQRQLFIQVARLDDLEKIYHLLIEN